MQTRMIGAHERADRAGAAGQSGHSCCGNASTMHARRRCRLPKGRTGRRARRGGAALIGRRRGATPDRTADRAACARQHAAILRFERRRTMRERLFALIQFR